MVGPGVAVARTVADREDPADVGPAVRVGLVAVRTVADRLVAPVDRAAGAPTVGRVDPAGSQDRPIALAASSAARGTGVGPTMHDDRTTAPADGTAVREGRDLALAGGRSADRGVLRDHAPDRSRVAAGRGSGQDRAVARGQVRVPGRIGRHEMHGTTPLPVNDRRGATLARAVHGRPPAVDRRETAVRADHTVPVDQRSRATAGGLIASGTTGGVPSSIAVGAVRPASRRSPRRRSSGPRRS